MSSSEKKEKIKEIWQQCQSSKLCLAITNHNSVCILYRSKENNWIEEDFEDDKNDIWREYRVIIKRIKSKDSEKSPLGPEVDIFARNLTLIRDNQSDIHDYGYFKMVLKEEEANREREIEKLKKLAKEEEDKRKKIEDEEKKMRKNAEIIIDGEKVNEDENPDFFEEILAVKKRIKKETRRSFRTIRVMQWNQKFLSYTEGDTTSEQQIVNISLTIQRENPDILIMEEIMGSKGEEAVKKIQETLNSGNKGKGIKAAKESEKYSVNVSLGALSNKAKGVQETFACLYRKEVVGELTTKILFKYGFSPTEDAFEHNKSIEEDGVSTRGKKGSIKEKFEEEMDENYFEIKLGDAIINIDEAMNVFKEYQGNCKNRWWFNSSYLENNNEDVGFDYKPVLFTFSGGKHFERFHVVGVHGSTGEKKYGSKKCPVREQNIMECVYLQSLCTQAARQNEFLVLLGDFNTQEAANFGNMGLWDMDMNLPTNVGKDRSWLYKEIELLQKTREKFLGYYGRAIDPRLPTNVFPSLAGLCVIPKHNDDIWIPKTMSKWKFYTGKCARIPGKVLEAWDNEAQDYYIKEEVCIDGDTSYSSLDEEEDDLEIKRETIEGKRRALNEMIAKLSMESDDLEENIKKLPMETSNPTRSNEEERRQELMMELKSKKKELKTLSQQLKTENQALSALDKSGEKSGADKRKAAKINSILANLWSDHRPVVASFEYCPGGV